MGVRLLDSWIRRAIVLSAVVSLISPCDWRNARDVPGFPSTHQSQEGFCPVRFSELVGAGSAVGYIDSSASLSCQRAVNHSFAGAEDRPPAG